MVVVVVAAPHLRLLHLRLVLQPGLVLVVAAPHLRLLHLRLVLHPGLVLVVPRYRMQPVFCNAACGIAGRAVSGKSWGNLGI